MFAVEHFVVSFSLGLLLALPVYYWTSTTGTVSSRGWVTSDGFIAVSRLLRLFLCFSVSSGALLLLHLRLDGVL